MKRKILFLILILLVIGLSFCSIVYLKFSRSDEKIISDIRELKSYQCDVRYVIKNSRGEIKEETNQLYSDNKGNRVDFGEDRIQVYNNEGKVKVWDKILNKGYETTNQDYSFYSISFINNLSKYLNDGSTMEMEYDKEINKRYLKVNVVLDNNNPNLDRAVLYVDIYERVPEKLLVFNKKGELVVEAFYNNFIRDAKVDETLFDLGE